MNPVNFFSCCCIMTLVFVSSTGYALETAPRISDREIIESLASLKEGQQSILREMDKRFEAMDKRFEAMDKRFEELRADMNTRFEIIDKRFEELRADMNQRFETIDKRFEEQSNLLVGIMVTFGGMVAIMIGFAIWDRRTMIRPFETKVRHIENELEPLLLETRQDRRRFQYLLDAVQVLARSNPQAAEILKGASLL